MRKHCMLFLCGVITVVGLVLVTTSASYASSRPTVATRGAIWTTRGAPAHEGENLGHRRRHLSEAARRRALARHRAELRRRRKVALLLSERLQAARTVQKVTPLAGGVWRQLRACESGGDYQENTGNGYFGAYQFSISTWRGLGLSGLPNEAAPTAQDAAAERLEAHDGWGVWPHCSATLGLV